MEHEHSQTSRFDNMNRQIQELVVKQDEMNKNIYNVLSILKGDDFANGMVDAVKDHEKRIKRLEDIKSRATWAVLGMSLPGGYGLMELLKKLLPFLLLSFISFSCISQKKKEDIANRYLRENPDQFAKLSSIYFPILPKKGQVIVYDTVTIVNPFSKEHPDCPPNTTKIITGTRVDTVPDLALIQSLKSNLQKIETSVAILNADRERLKSNKKYLIITVVILSIALVSSLYLLFKP